MMRMHSARMLRIANRRNVASVLVTSALAIAFLLFVLNFSAYEQTPGDVTHGSDAFEHDMNELERPDDTEQSSGDVVEHPESPGGLRFSGSGQII